ncbi:hypothetical protein NEMIN01_1165 [Nematocida minor]|uniref:uncharacterized protein n=1 Tax=Nematocida minor TaxID=1912983 RepID=UPI002220E87F|nr:uncharacterized protein NEMIN01_1165 [Nematocida minor]KAI5190700.1 hypothetical protein NEMIN01_1165 [Nematocida minor]
MHSSKRANALMSNLYSTRTFNHKYNMFINGLFLILLLIYSILSLHLIGQFLFLLHEYYSQHSILLQYNLLALTAFTLFSYLVNYLIERAYIKIGDNSKFNEMLKNKKVEDTSPPPRDSLYEIYIHIRRILLGEFSLFFLFITIPWRSVHPTSIILSCIGVSITGALVAHFYTSRSMKNAIKYYLVGQMEKILNIWLANSRTLALSRISLVFGTVYLYISTAVLFSAKNNQYANLIDACISVHTIWSLLIFIVLNIYMGYLSSEYRTIHSENKSVSVGLMKYMAANMSKRMHKICGISLVHGVLSVLHTAKRMLKSKSKSEVSARVPRPRERYDQLEMEVVNYLVFDNYYSRDKEGKDNFMSRYWIVTKSMSIGMQIFDYSSISIYPILVLLVKSIEVNRMLTLSAYKEVAINLLWIFLTGSGEGEKKESIGADEKAYKILGGHIPLRYYLLCTLSVFMLFVGVRSFVCMSFRSIFMLKDGHIEDREKTTEKVFNDVVNELYGTLFSRDPDDRMAEEETSQKIYDTQLINTLDSL